MKLILIFVILVFFFNQNLICQEKYELQIIGEDFQKITHKSVIKSNSQKEVIAYLQKIHSKVIKKGYLISSIDSTIIRENKIIAYAFLGPKFTSCKLSFSDSIYPLIKGFNKSIQKNQINIKFSKKEIYNLLSSTHSYLKHNGYPFSKVYLSKIEIKENELFAELKINLNNRISIGEIHSKGNAKINEKILATYLDLKKGTWYDDKIIQKIPEKITQLQFLSEIKPFELLFYENKVDIFFYLNSKPISNINGTLGLQQKSPDVNIPKYGLTGEFHVKLINTLKYAEKLEINWRNIQQNTQLLSLKTSIPLLFKSRFGLDGDFRLYKKDSSFLELNSGMGVQYLLDNGNYLKIFYKTHQSNILLQDKKTAIDNGFSSINSRNYGINLTRQTLDYLPNPRSGQSISLSISYGNRKNKDSLSNSTQNSNIYLIDLEITNYIPLSKRNIFKIHAKTNIYNAPNYFQNELLRFGGMNSLRGFKEEELRATSLLIASLEYRYLLEKNSYIYLFFDQCWYENKFRVLTRDNPFGIGTGISFGTNIGIFSISYGIGKQLNNPMLLKNGNVHFGYISYF